MCTETPNEIKIVSSSHPGVQKTVPLAISLLLWFSSNDNVAGLVSRNLMRGLLGSSLQGVITVNTLVLRGSNASTAKFLGLVRIHAENFGKSEQS
jgi:hypothetical protein